MLRWGAVLVAGVAVAVLGGGARASTDAQSPAQTVRTPDGLLTVAVPRGALPTGVRLRVRVLPRSAFPRELRGAAGSARLYELLPRRTRTRRPIRIVRRVDPRTTSAGSSGATPVTILALRRPNGRWTQVTGQRIAPAGRFVDVSGQTSDLSVVAVFDGRARVTLTPKRKTLAVGRSFAAAARISGGGFGIDGGRFSAARSPFLAVRTTPNLSGRPGDALSGTITCSRAGSGSFEASAQVVDVGLGPDLAALLGAQHARTTVLLAGRVACRAAEAPTPPAAGLLRGACVTVTHSPRSGFPSFLTYVLDVDPGQLPQASPFVEILIEGGNDDRPATAPIAKTGRTSVVVGIRSYGRKPIRRLLVKGKDETASLRRLLGDAVEVTAQPGRLAGSGCD